MRPETVHNPARPMPADRGRRGFATTQWSLVLAAADPASTKAEPALASLCEIYWLPVYAFIRRTGASIDDARDLTQAFFLKVIEKGYFKDARQDRGRFRTFLLTSVRHFLANEYDAARTLKRGGGAPHLPLEFDDGERQYLLEPVEDETPERVYERRWALRVMDHAMDRLAARYTDPERRQLFQALRPMLTGDDPGSYGDAAAALGVKEGALRVALFRLRKSFAATLRDVVAQTVEHDDDVDGELQHLLAIVSR
jgi:RNA polymerase sigma factor (sigma-70 family)